MTHDHANHQPQQGFTLVELLLALAFVAFILIFAVTAIIEVMGTYNKGLAVKEINQVGRSVVEDMSRIVRAADPGAINVNALTSGRVCFGAVSYVWNKWDTPPGSLNQYEGGGDLVMARVNDNGGAMCDNSSGSYPDIERDKASDLLTDRVWVHNIDVDKSADGDLVDLAVQISVADDPADPALQGGTCVGGPSGQFCATSRFNATVTTRGGN